MRRSAASRIRRRSSGVRGDAAGGRGGGGTQSAPGGTGDAAVAPAPLPPRGRRGALRPTRRAAVVAGHLRVPALEVGEVLVGERARRVVLRVEVRVHVLGLGGEALVHRVQVGREAPVGLVHVGAVVLHDLDRVVVGPDDLLHHPVRLQVGLRLGRVVLGPLDLEEVVDRRRHVGVVGRDEGLEDAVAAHRHARPVLRLLEAEAEAGDVHAAERVAGDEAGVGPAAEAHRLQGEVDVLADEGLLHDLHRQHPLLDLDDAHLAGGVEPAGVDPALEAGRAEAVGLVHHREAVLGREVDEQQVDVLERHVGDRHEQRRAGHVRVPVIEDEQPRQAGRQLGAAGGDLGFLAPRTSSRMKSIWASCDLPERVASSPFSGTRFHMSRK